MTSRLARSSLLLLGAKTGEAANAGRCLLLLLLCAALRDLSGAQLCGESVQNRPDVAFCPWAAQ